MAHGGLGELGADALAEMWNIGCGHALTSISRLGGGMRLSMSVPEISRGAECLRLMSTKAGVAVRLKVLGTAPSTFLVLATDSAARTFCRALLGYASAQATSRGRAWETCPERCREIQAPELGNIEYSAFAELGNVACCAALGAVAQLLRVRLVPGTPIIENGGLGELVARQALAFSEPIALVTRVLGPLPDMEAALVLVTNDVGAGRWVSEMGVAAGA